MSEEKPVYSKEKIEELVKQWRSWKTRDKIYIPYNEREKLKNTIEKLEADLKSLKGLKRFMETGVCVTDQLVLACRPEEYHDNIFLRAFGEREGQIRVDLTVEEAKRLAKMLEKVIEAAKYKRNLLILKNIYEEKFGGHRRYY